MMLETVKLSSIRQAQILEIGSIAYTGDPDYRVVATKIDDSLWAKSDGEHATDLDMVGWIVATENGLDDSLLKEAESP